MNLTNNQSLKSMRRVSVEKDLKDFSRLISITERLDDKSKMADNIDVAREKYNELLNLYHEDFLKSSNKGIYEDNLKTMEEIVLKKPRSFNDLVIIYEASSECDNIYKSFRGGKIE